MRNVYSHCFRERKGSSLCLSALSTLSSISSKSNPCLCSSVSCIWTSACIRHSGRKDEKMTTLTILWGLHASTPFSCFRMWLCTHAVMQRYLSTERDRVAYKPQSLEDSLGGFVYLTPFMLGSINTIFLYNTAHHHHASWILKKIYSLLY